MMDEQPGEIDPDHAYNELAAKLQAVRFARDVALWLCAEARWWAEEGWRAVGPNDDDQRDQLPWWPEYA